MKYFLQCTGGCCFSKSKVQSFASALENREKNCFFVAVYLLSKVNGVKFDIVTNGNPLSS